MKNNNCNPLRKCLCCNSTDLKIVLDLNSQPLANSYLKSKSDNEDEFPLAINFCKNCTHIQLTHAVDPDKLFRDYLYVSGTTKTLKEYFDWFVDFTEKFTKNKNVLDIACNDGTQLDSYKARGYSTHGIDPAKNLYELSSKKEHSIVCDYLTKESINKFNINFDVIIAQNVFAHNANPKGFLETCKERLSEDGYIFIQTSQADMILNNQFDTIYHEHISFFSVKSFCSLAKRSGLNVVEVVRTPVHGTSFVFVLSKKEKCKSEEFIKKEINLTIERMEQYSALCKKIATDTFVKIQELKKDGYKIIGYGAAAKGNTFLNFSKIDLDYIIDDNELKQNLYTPGSKIKITSIDELGNESGKICIVPLAWNFFEEIKNRICKKTNKKINFIKYFPEVQFI
jgi:2-polyprenyl-3-methyl-5-hydroxy-6-metoxy-1,4-benzoquinol methylase